MHRRIRITAGEVEGTATLTHSPTAEAVWSALPLSAAVNRWGEEIYFRIPVEASEAEDARDEMSIGELAYWPAGSAFCIFFGRTPASLGDEPRAAGNVNPIGMLEQDPHRFTEVPEGAEIRVEAIVEGD